MKTIVFNGTTFTCPYADVLPPLQGEERAALRNHILQHGVLVPIVLDELNNVLDGHNRLEIAVELKLTHIPIEVKRGLSAAEKHDLAEDLNLHRRQLTRQEIRSVLERRLKAAPERSDRDLAKELHVDHKTVGKARRRLETTGEIPQLPTAKGADGKTRRRPVKQAPQVATPEAHGVHKPMDEPIVSELPPATGADVRVVGREWSATLRTYEFLILKRGVESLHQLAKVKVADRDLELVRKVASALRDLGDKIEGWTSGKGAKI